MYLDAYNNHNMFYTYHLHLYHLLSPLGRPSPLWSTSFPRPLRIARLAYPH